MFCACCLLPWLQSPSIWRTVLFHFNAGKRIQVEALCIFLNKDIFSLAALLGIYEITSKTKAKHSHAALHMDQYYYWLFQEKGVRRVALTETYLNCSLMPATCSLGLVSLLLICWQSGSNYLCKADLIQCEIAASLLLISVTPSGENINISVLHL